MALSDAPWLDGLDGTTTWKPAKLQQTSRPSSVTHNAGSLVNKQTRIPRRSISGISVSSSRKTRSPLAPLDKNEHSRREDDAQSDRDGSIVIRGTVQQRAKSSSPGKKEASLEWRKRLLNGKIGYGDQTDLFGPSGLENIFSSGGHEGKTDSRVKTGNLSWLPKSDNAMPSSPPPWPNNLRTVGTHRMAELRLSSDQSQPQETSRAMEDEDESSVVSNPFELEYSNPDRPQSDAVVSKQVQRAVSEIDRTVSGPTMLEQEDFSPVILSRHTTVSGTIGYSPVKHSETASKDPSFVVSVQQATIQAPRAQPQLHPAKTAVLRLRRQEGDGSVFTDGPSSALDAPQAHDLSLSENLPTGTPEPLGSNVQIQRGGYSTIGSFRNKALSVDPSAVSNLMPEESSELLPSAPTPPTRAPAQIAKTPARTARQTSFGNGELNTHAFDAQLGLSTPDNKGDRTDEDVSPASDIAVPGSKVPLAFQAQLGGTLSSAASTQRRPRLPSKAEQTPYPKASLLSKRARNDEDATHQADCHVTRPTIPGEHKRLPASPLKNSTPKRRRTLHATELAEDARRLARGASSALQATVYDKSDVDDSIAVGTLSLPRPRNPTPLAEPEKNMLPDDLREATDDFLAQEDRNAVEDVLERVEQSLSEADPDTFREQAEEIAAEVAKYTIKINKSESDGQGERTKSVTTQDFFREAEFVMEYIRARAAKKPSLLASVEETENTNAQIEVDVSLRVPKDHGVSDEYMRVSREPSWADRPRSRWREPEQVRLQREAVDINRVASQLRRWKEPESIEEQDAFLAEPMVSHDEQPENTSSSEVVYDERAKIRITRPSSEYAHALQDDTQPRSQHSTQSSSNTTRRTENVGTLAPDAVAHLIGSEVGGMTFDKDKQRWVRVRSPEHRAVKNGYLDVQESHLTSEDDPFREISDLAVDANVEQRRISSPTRLALSEVSPQDLRASSIESAETVKKLSISGNMLQHTHANGKQILLQPSLSEIPSASTVEHTIEDAAATADAARKFFNDHDSVNDGPNTCTSAPEAKLLRQLREDVSGGSCDPSGLPLHSLRPSTAVELFPKPPLHDAAVFGLSGPLPSDHDRREISELSFVAPLAGDRLISVSLSVSKPALPKQAHIGRIVEESSPLRYQSSLLLSDLPDFTVNQDDPLQPSERALARRFAHHAAIEVKDRFAAATKELVKALTDVHSEEPFWQELHEVDLHDQALLSMNGLDTFCENIRTLNVSNNKLTNLNGIPQSLRRLSVRANQLSSITSMTHLPNLQHIDVSGNSLETLHGLSGCLHLRELTANDCGVTTLDDVAHLDLIKLRCRGSSIERLEFKEGQFAELTHLDLTGSSITYIEGLEQLRRLTSLKLSSNQLSHGFGLAHELPSLEHLVLRDCDLTELDVSCMPNLQTLVLDDNALSSITGLSALANLDMLTLRRQRLSADQPVDIFNQKLEARRVYLSGNKLARLCIGADQLALKHLDLAAVGLLDLPSDLGLRMPNLRHLNLNFNSIKNVKPLLHLVHLQDLQLCGNRLSRLRKTSAVLAKLPNLTRLDIRDNPLSQGFYATPSLLPTQVALIRRDNATPSEEDEAEPGNVDWKLYIMHEQDRRKDEQHIDRLDEDTRLRRRVYDMLIAHSCRELQNLDGLPFSKAHALRKDRLWHRLLELGVVRKAR